MSALVVARVRGVASIQDGGRRGRMHDGVPRGGALVPELLARANVALGNAWDAPAIELEGAIVVEARAATRVACDDEVRALAAGERAEVRARYVAIAGGFDVPEHLGGRGALVAAGIGAWLRAGDELRASDALHAGGELQPRAADVAPAFTARDVIRVVPGPDLAAFDDALATLLSAELTVTTRDRVGTRLRGADLARRDADAALSTPMVRGAIQVPASGELIVLGPDHPTTGGYPVAAVVIRADLGHIGAKRPGERVRFCAVTLEEARLAWRKKKKECAHFFPNRNHVP